MVTVLTVPQVWRPGMAPARKAAVRLEVPGIEVAHVARPKAAPVRRRSLPGQGIRSQVEPDVFLPRLLIERELADADGVGSVAFFSFFPAYRPTNGAELDLFVRELSRAIGAPHWIQVRKSNLSIARSDVSPVYLAVLACGISPERLSARIAWSRGRVSLEVASEATPRRFAIAERSRLVSAALGRERSVRSVGFGEVVAPDAPMLRRGHVGRRSRRSR